jgi:hypothetical protein
LLGLFSRVHRIWKAGTMPPVSGPALRLIDIPDAAPPYDCETHGAGCPAAREQAGLVAAEAEPGAAPVRVGASPTGAGATAAWPRQFAQVMVEILAGVRPQRQVVPWTTDRVRARIRHLGPVLAADRRPRIQRVVTSRPTACVVEMTVVVSFGPRSRALAMRFEHVAARQAAPGLPARPARWLCTELETRLPARLVDRRLDRTPGRTTQLVPVAPTAPYSLTSAI